MSNEFQAYRGKIDFNELIRDIGIGFDVPAVPLTPAQFLDILLSASLGDCNGN